MFVDNIFKYKTEGIVSVKVGEESGVNLDWT
jgi:hypothetical protein